MLKSVPRLAIAVCLASAAAVFTGACGADGDGHDGHDHAAHGGQDEHEGEEGVVHLSEEQVKRAGIRVAPAGPAPMESLLRLDAVVAENEDTQSHVNPRAAGLVRAIHKRLGDVVEQGDVLCEIDSVELGEAVSAYLSARLTSDAARSLLAKEEELFRDRVETRTRVLDGAIALARRVRDREKELEGQGISTLRPLLEAEQALQEAELGKEQALTELRAERDTRLLERRAAAESAEIAQHAAEDRLRILNVAPEAVRAQNDRQGGSLGLYKVAAPRSGVIIARDVTLDEFVGPETTLFELHDPSVAWVVASVYERDLRTVQRGQSARVFLNAFPGEVIEGRVALIAYEVSPKTRAARLRIEIPNKPLKGWAEPFPLRPGLFGTVEIVTERRQVALAVPETAIVHEGPLSFVFVRTGPGEFQRRAVRIGLRTAGTVEIVDGIEGGEDVAVDGTFVLKSAARAEELGGGHSH